MRHRRGALRYEQYARRDKQAQQYSCNNGEQIAFIQVEQLDQDAVCRFNLGVYTGLVCARFTNVGYRVCMRFLQAVEVTVRARMGMRAQDAAGQHEDDQEPDQFVRIDMQVTRT